MLETRNAPAPPWRAVGGGFLYRPARRSRSRREGGGRDGGVLPFLIRTSQVPICLIRDWAACKLLPREDAR